MDGKEKLEALMRSDAENFVMVVSVYTDEFGGNPNEVALTALKDALARLTESGALGTAAVD